MQCLDVDNLIKLFTAVLLERRILLRSNKYFPENPIFFKLWSDKKTVPIDLTDYPILQQGFLSYAE